MKIHELRKLKGKIQHLICISTVIISAIICYNFIPESEYRVSAFILLLTTTMLAMVFDIMPVFAASALSALIWNFFFIPPIFTFHIQKTEDSLMFLMYFGISSLNSVLNNKIRSEERKSLVKEKKESALRLYNTLFNSLSHELRTPIATIIGAVDALDASGNKITAEQRSELMHQIASSGGRLNRQVDNLLNISRLESGIISPKPDWCDLQEIIFGITSKLNKGNSTIIKVITPEDLPLFKIDHGLLEQVIENLLQNSIQYNPDKVEITLQVLATETGLFLTISDNGIGIPSSEQKQVFEKFYRLPHAPAGGTGLGLSIVKGYVEAMNGHIQIKPVSESQGVTFEIRMPCEMSYLNSIKNE